MRELNVAYFTASVDAPEENKKFAESLGADYPILNHVSLRAEYRGLVYSAPDFGLRNLNTDKITHAAQPSAGIVFRF